MMSVSTQPEAGSLTLNCQLQTDNLSTLPSPFRLIPTLSANQMKSLPIQRVPISLIDRNDHTFSLMPFDDPPSKELTKHIVHSGILHPPILKQTESGNFLIVSGRKRLRIIGDLLKLAACDCLIVPVEFDPLATLALALNETLLSGPVNPLTKAVFFSKAIALCPPEEAARRFLPLFGLAPHPYHLQQIVGIATLEQPLALALHQGRLEEKTAIAMTGLSFRDRFAIFDLIDTLHLSVSSQRKLIIICQDLAKRHDTSIHDILAAQELREIIDHPEANAPQKTTQAMQYLTRKHAPNLAAAEKEFSQLTKRLNLPKGASLSHSPSYEKDELTLSLTFANQEALLAAWPALLESLIMKYK
ncbi:MAG: hypothetical protein FP815_14860 [Desulfobulbaceae bacterium]|nr:hypothetical protein [Desulfobulbaceae bacterium]